MDSVIIVLLYYPSSECLPEENVEEENLTVTGAVTTSCLKSRL